MEKHAKFNTIQLSLNLKKYQVTKAKIINYLKLNDHETYKPPL